MHEPCVPAPVVRFGPFELDVHLGELRKGRTRLKVPDQSIEILKTLLERPGELVTREQLRERLWPSNTFVDFEHGVNAAIRRLRDALGDSADAPKYIETLPRRGYRFIGALEPAPTLVATRPIVTEIPPPTRRFTLSRWLLAASIAVALIVGVWIGSRRATVATSVESAPPTSVPVTTYPGWESAPAISPDGKYVAFERRKDASSTADIYVKLIDGGEPVPLTTDAAPDVEPAWSPDGNRIAFLRRIGIAGHVVVVVPAFGGPERRLDQTRGAADTGVWWATGLSWTRDGRSVLFTDRGTSAATSAIFVCPIDSGERRQLTWPTTEFTDAVPRMSPDGRYLAFVRRPAGTLSGDVFIQDLADLQPVGQPRKLTQGVRTRTLDWFPDSASIVYDVGFRSLWRTTVRGSSPQPLLTNVSALHPSVAPDGTRLIYELLRGDQDIWKVPVPLARQHVTTPGAPLEVINSTASDNSAQFSPDGRSIVFVSSRSGESELWVSASDGSHPMQVTTLGTRVGSPRWSADGASVAFDSLRSGSWNIYAVGSQGGIVNAMTRDPSANVRPSWSGDGRWIYFGSTRSGRWEIWKVPSRGGAPVQVTRHGGFEAFESPDGRLVYYTRLAETPGIWQVPVDGGEELQIVNHGVSGHFAVAGDGLYLVDPQAKPRPMLEFCPFGSHRLSPVVEWPGSVLVLDMPEFHVSHDGRWILYTHRDEAGSDIAMLTGIR